jgi:hypothetical protein
MEYQSLPQKYDNTLKALLGQEADEILTTLVPGCEFVDTENIEHDSTILKAALAYNITYKGKPHILNMELQTEEDSEVEVRVLRYHVSLHAEHDLPVISVILYPFKTKIPQPPYEEKNDDEVLLTFKYRVIPLWKMDARPFVRDHVISMYTLLPAMKWAGASLLIRAVNEMKLYYTPKEMSAHLVRFKAILRKSKTISSRDKEKVLKELAMYDYFIDENPDVQERVSKGEVQTEIRVLREMVLAVVEHNFPGLLDLAQEQIELINEPDNLRRLITQMLKAPTEASARKMLQLSVK